ncbi:MAG: hypothetical protein J0L72_11575 [Armatimonadetes bacterium]|nr:hypothetical protein [Armatimonadota bacterium]
MLNQIRTLSIGAMLMVGALATQAQSNRPAPRSTTAETGLVGIKLYDSGARVINMYGSPDEITGITKGGSGAVGGGPGGGSGGGGNASGAGSQQMTLDSMVGDPFGQGNTEWRQLRPPSGDEPTDPSGAGGGGRPGANGAGGGGGDAGAGATGGGERVVYTRWLYKRPKAHYAFIFDKFNRVIQIEALGLTDSKPKTRKGACFGKEFGFLIKAYGSPDAYEISGSNIVVRYLVKDRVAFRLSKIDPKKKHVITGIVVAAGKA